jgi:hypothetical protein
LTPARKTDYYVTPMPADLHRKEAEKTAYWRDIHRTDCFAARKGRKKDENVSAIQKNYYFCKD